MTDPYLALLIGYGLALFLSIIIARAIFSIGTIVKQLKAQTELLALIAKESGVDIDKINSIYAASKGRGYTAVKKDK